MIPGVLFQVIVGTADREDRWLVTPEQVRFRIDSPESDDALLGNLINGVSAACARYCKLAADGTRPATFGRETVRATWPAISYGSRTPSLVLPWRAPIASLTVVEDGVTLVQNTDYILTSAGVIYRLVSNVPGYVWPSSAVVVNYVVGWILGDEDADQPPGDLTEGVIDQVRMLYAQRELDPNIRSEDVSGVWSGTYNFAGGDAVGKSGLLRSLEAALEPFRVQTVA